MEHVDPEGVRVQRLRGRTGAPAQPGPGHTFAEVRSYE